MYVLIYFIIALALLIAVAKKYEEDIKEDMRTKDMWLESPKFLLACSMLAFPLTIPALGLSKLISKIIK